MALAVQKEVLWFEIPINYVFAVKILQGTDYFSCVETAGGSRESASCSQVGEKLASSNELQQHVDSRFVPSTPEPKIRSKISGSAINRKGKNYT